MSFAEVWTVANPTQTMWLVASSSALELFETVPNFSLTSQSDLEVDWYCSGRRVVVNIDSRLAGDSEGAAAEDKNPLRRSGAFSDGEAWSAAPFSALRPERASTADGGLRSWRGRRRLFGLASAAAVSGERGSTLLVWVEFMI